MNRRGFLSTLALATVTPKDVGARLSRSWRPRVRYIVRMDEKGWRIVKTLTELEGAKGWAVVTNGADT